MQKKQLETLLYSVVGVGAMFLIIVAINLILGLAKKRIDLTHEKVYTLSLAQIAITTWLIARWTSKAGTPGANRLLVLALYLSALGYAVHPAGFLTRSSMAFQDERIARNPTSVVSITSSRLMPSMPIRYFAPMLGIQSARSTIWKLPTALSKRETSRSEIRKLAKPTRFAQTLMRFFCEPGISNRITRPASGAKAKRLEAPRFKRKRRGTAKDAKYAPGRDVSPKRPLILK